MSRGLYIVSTAASSGKSLVVLGVMELLSRSVERVGFFRPVVGAVEPEDNDIALIRHRYRHDQAYETSYALTQLEAQQLIAAGQSDELLKRIYSRYKDLESECEFVLCEGTDLTGISSAFEFDFNAQVANQLGCPVLIVVNGHQKSAAEVVSLTRAARESFVDEHCTVTAIVVNRVQQDDRAQIAADLSQNWPHPETIYVLPEHPTLGKPTLEEIVRHLNARLVHGGDDWTKNEVLDTKIAAMHLANYLDRLVEGCLVITPGDRSDIILGSIAGVYSESSPTIVGMILTGGIAPAPQVLNLVVGLKRAAVPIFSVEGDTYETTMTASSVRAQISPDNDRKIATALGVFEKHVDTAALRARINAVRSTRITPLMFTQKLVERAEADRKRIVLPEGTDERILRQLRSFFGVELPTLFSWATSRSCVRRPPPSRLILPQPVS